jgi:hypothetical protein
MSLKIPCILRLILETCFSRFFLFFLPSPVSSVVIDGTERRHFLFKNKEKRHLLKKMNKNWMKQPPPSLGKFAKKLLIKIAVKPKKWGLPLAIFPGTLDPQGFLWQYTNDNINCIYFLIQWKPLNVIIWTRAKLITLTE